MLPTNYAAEAAKLASEIRLPWAELSLPEAFRPLRKRRAMDQFALSRHNGLSQPGISRLENGRGDPSWTTIQRVFLALDRRPLLLPRPVNDWPWYDAQWRERVFEE